MTEVAALVAALALSFANGANDNFKGVATLHGSGLLTYRRALAWATITTLAGSLCAVFLAQGLALRFSGKGLVPASLVGDPLFLASVALGAAAAVLLATRVGMPISTTHALTGALVGAALATAGPAHVAYATLGGSLLLPLLLSPLLALALAALIAASWRASSKQSRSEAVCLCAEPVSVAAPAGVLALAVARVPRVGTVSECQRHGAQVLAAARPSAVIDRLHVLSAGAVGFARGLNDTPKIAALMLVAGGLAWSVILATALVMAMGGLLAARRVAGTMAFRITGMDAEQGFWANAVTATLVGLASPLGLPVSTTHVSCGALFGIGAVSGQGRWPIVRQVIGAWLVTLPIAAMAAATATAGIHWYWGPR